MTLNANLVRSQKQSKLIASTFKFLRMPFPNTLSHTPTHTPTHPHTLTHTHPHHSTYTYTHIRMQTRSYVDPHTHPKVHLITRTWTNSIENLSKSIISQTREMFLSRFMDSFIGFWAQQLTIEPMNERVREDVRAHEDHKSKYFFPTESQIIFFSFSFSVKERKI